jgi:hypothetical protein
MRKLFLSLAVASFCSFMSGQNSINLKGAKNTATPTYIVPVKLSLQNNSPKPSNNFIETELNTLIHQGTILQSDSAFILNSEHLSSTSGIHHYYFNQAINGLEVFGTQSSIHLGVNGAVIKANIKFVKDILQMATASSASLTAEQAVTKVAQQMGYSISNLQELERNSFEDQEVLFNKAGISGENIPAKLMYYYKENSGVYLVWEISVQENHTSNWFNFRVDATTGTIIDKDNWTISCNIVGDHSMHVHSNAIVETENCEDSKVASKITVTALTHEESMVPTYEVFALPLRSPYSGGRTNVVNPANAVASPLGWHDDGSSTFTRTQGNNVRCYDDDDNTNSPSNVNDYAEGGAGLVFQFPLQSTNGAGQPVYSNGSQSEDAAVSHLFYLSNIIHDIIFQFGMDEAGGAFQEDNFGNGGVGGDSVNAEAQDGLGTCNANFGTPADGGNPRMQMYTCGNRDASFDNEVVIHEYAHGISNRLTGGPGASGCLGNQEQMGEGWSDYYGLMFTMTNTEAGDDARGMGNWLDGGGINGGGIRTHPYSTDFSENPHTYGDINSEVAPHGVGSVWAMMIWEMTWEIMNKYEAANGNGFNSNLYVFTGNATTDAGNIQALALVTEGLKLQACSPGFVDGRDAILMADQNIYGGANQCEIWAAFARRGLGYSADQGGSNSKTDGTQAFDLPPNTAILNVSANNFCPTDSVQNNLSGGSPLGGTYSGPGVIDNGDGATFTFDPAIAGSGTHTINYNVVDGCSGAVVDKTDTIVVEDGLPDLVCENITLELDASGNASLTWQDVITGSDVVQSQYTYGTAATAFETLTGAATTLGLGDDQITTAIPMGFDFELYGETFSDFYVSSNGFIYFTPNGGMTVSQSNTAQTLPNVGIPNGLVALFWEDLDPSAGGTIKFQVFGSAPNRKLVVAFNAVPYWNSPEIATGQIHINESSNIIEIHIEEAGFSGRLKTMGIEGAFGTNGLTNSGTNNSGWSIASPGFASVFTPNPNTFAPNCGNAVSLSLSQTNFTCLDVGDNEVIVTADDGNGGISMCTTIITVTPNPVQLTTYNSGWSNGTPNNTSVANFTGNYSTSSGDIEACSCIVEPSAIVTVRANEYLNIQGNITVDGTLIVEHQGSVVQANPTATVTKNPTTGFINVNVTTPVLQQRAFMVMGSPMDIETRGGVFTNAFLVLDHTPNNFNPNTHPNIPQGATNFSDLEGDFWTSYSGGINPGEGYIVRPQTGYGDPAGITYDMTYALGTLNNGTVNRPMIYNVPNSPAGTPNVYANPYPSAINSDVFIQDNGLNALYFWEHLTPPSVIVPGEGLKFDMDDVSIRNDGGGVPANNDNPLNIPTNVISTGQGFAIKATTNGTVSFTNDMRLTTGNTTLRTNEEEVDRLWLHIESDEYQLANNMLLGFNPQATAGIDTGYDTDRLACSVSLYSQLETGDARMSIQTRESFSDAMKIPVGFSTLIEEETGYTISLSNFEGDNLIDRAIYIYDTELNILIDLTQGDYTFRSDVASQDRRFTVVFERDEEVLGTNEGSLDGISVYPNPTNGTLHIVSTRAQLEAVKVYDVLGRQVAKENLDNVQGYQLDMSRLKTAVYFVEIITPQGTIIKRILKK